MSVDHDDLKPGARDGAGPLLARAAAADARAERRLAAIARDLGSNDDTRLDDEARAVTLAVLGRLIATIENDIRIYASRVLSAKGGNALTVPAGLADRMMAAGLLDDTALVAELIARAWIDIVTVRLPVSAPDDPERPSLLPRLANGPDRVVASAASAMMAADVRRRGQDADAGRSDLPAELHHRLVWWVAAALRPADATPATDAALTDAARRALAAHDEGARVEATAGRLAAALDAAPAALPTLVEEALADRRLALVAALLAQGLAIDSDRARDMLLDPDGDRLWLALRALDFPRSTIARIGLALCEADRRRDADRFVDLLDALMTTPIAAAQQALAPLKLPGEYRSAIAAMAYRQ